MNSWTFGHCSFWLQLSKRCMIYILLVLCLLCKYNEFCCDFLRGCSNKSHGPTLGSAGSGGGVGSPGGKKPERRLRSSPRNSEPDTHTQGRTCTNTRAWERLVPTVNEYFSVLNVYVDIVQIVSNRKEWHSISNIKHGCWHEWVLTQTCITDI